jgi:hypothetical protein
MESGYYCCRRLNKGINFIVIVAAAGAVALAAAG